MMSMMNPARRLLNIPMIRFGKWRWPKFPTIKLKHAIALALLLWIWRYFGGYLLKELAFWDAVWMGAIYALAPQVLMVFLIPWSPGGKIIQRIPRQAWTLVYTAILGGLLYFLYMTLELMYRHLPSDTAQHARLILEMVGIHILSIIIIPAILWTTEPPDIPGDGDDKGLMSE